MSQAKSPGETLAAGALGLPPQVDPAAEIEAELRDHLATAADQLQQQGLPPAVAKQKAQENFGDLAAISRRCYWIKQGDTVMFRWVIVALLSIVCVALGITAVGSWRAQSRMAEQMGALAAELRAVAESQRAPLPPVAVLETKPLEITGKIYLGSPDKPAANTEVMICRVGDGEIMRRVSTDGAGAFRSGPLAEGDYYVLSKEPPDAPHPHLGFQSAPVYLYPGAPPANVDLDVAHAFGRVAVELSQPLPRLEVEGQYTIDSRLVLQVSPKFLRPIRWTTKSPAPARWPLRISDAEGDPHSKDYYALWSRAVVGNQELAAHEAVQFPGGDGDLTAGKYEVTASIATDIKPWELSEELQPIWSGSSGDQPIRWMSEYWVNRSLMGKLWHAKLNKSRVGDGMHLNPTFYAKATAVMVELQGGAVTRLTVEIPNDLVSRLQTLVETTTDPQQFEKAAKQGEVFIRAANVAVQSDTLNSNETTKQEDNALAR